ncbi:hypothetical protein ON010_g8509 [Phytophthora cinnamomi]|nr:hypothetical protein ON010_g8509 [Phytophthora cinnamomi]
MAHSAITTRLFDIEFGVCDLSVLHFPRFDLDAQLDRKKSKAINMRNFPSKAELPELPERPAYHNLVEALSVLYAFAKEFFNEETKDIFAAAKDFGERLEDFAPWSSYEINILAFWFSNVLEAYRLAVINDIRTGANTRRTFSINVREQFSALPAVLCWGKQWSTSIHHALTHVTVPDAARKVYDGSWSPFSDDPRPTPPEGDTSPLGNNGPNSATGSKARHGYLNTIRPPSRSDWYALPSTDGRYHAPATGSAPDLPPPFSPRLATSSGIIRCTHDLSPSSTQVTQQRSEECGESVHRLNPGHPSRAPCSNGWQDYKKPYQHLFLGAALLGFFYLLRSSEYLVVKGGRHKYALERRHVEVFDTEGKIATNFHDATLAVITLRGSKTDQQGHGTSPHFRRSGHPRVCPVFGAALLLELAEKHHLRQTDPI